MKRIKKNESGSSETKIKRFKNISPVNDQNESDITEVKTNDLLDINLNMNTFRLGSEFYDENCVSLSKKLLNKYLVRRVELNADGDKFALVVGRIVETEAYVGGDDKASHTYQNKQTDRLKAMYMKAGTAYVYNIYGMYCCLNISAREPGAGVLIRALEPVYGVELMKKHRNLSAASSNKHPKELTNGPSKLCLAMMITKSLFNQVDLALSDALWLQNDLIVDKLEQLDKTNNSLPFKIVSAKRVGIDYAGEEAINKLYRFYIKDCKFVSIKAKEEIVDD